MLCYRSRIVAVLAPPAASSREKCILPRLGDDIIRSGAGGWRLRFPSENTKNHPTILAATIVQSAREVGPGALEALGYGPLLVGFVVSAIVGTIALKLVLVLLYRAQLKVFAIYLFLLAGLVAMGFLDGLL